MRSCLPLFGICVLLLSFSNGKAQDVYSAPAILYSTDAGINPGSSPASDSAFTINDIIITGAKRTRKSTILRELPFHINDAFTLPEIIKKVAQAQRQLMNTGLFRRATVQLNSLDSQRVFVSVMVTEKWYFFPQPFVRIANGTFSQWSDRGRRLSDLNYGVKLTQYNFSGRGDKAHVHFTNGYTKKVALQYQGFYFDKALKWSGSVNLAHGKNRELNYTTENNRLLAVKNPEGYVFEFYQASFDVGYRPAIKTRHQFSVGYNSNRIADTVIKLNIYYSPSNATYSYPYLTYAVSFTDYDFNPYPTRGQYGEASLHKAGINSAINLWQLSARGVKYWPVGSRGYVSIRLGGTLKLPFKQPYITQQFLGYGDAFLQGYENYIVDGVAGAYSRQTIGYNVLSTQIPMPNSKWFKSLRTVPLKLYVKGFTNAGYVHNPNTTLRNELNNKMLYSSGVGLDIVAFVDVIFKIEWSFNQLGQNGLYLHQ